MLPCATQAPKLVKLPIKSGAIAKGSYQNTRDLARHLLYSTYRLNLVFLSFTRTSALSMEAPFYFQSS